MSVCPLHGEGRRAPPVLVNAGLQPPTPQKSGHLHFTTPLSLSCTAPQQVPLLISTCSLQLLPLPTLTLRVNLQQKCHMKPPRSCSLRAWPSQPRKKGQARCPTVSHAGSPGFNWSNSAVLEARPCSQHQPGHREAKATPAASPSSQNGPQLQMLFTHRCHYWVAALPFPRDISHPKRSPGCWHWPDHCARSRKLGTSTSSSQTSGLPANPG